jgi:hypothetical protein
MYGRFGDNKELFFEIQLIAANNEQFSSRFECVGKSIEADYQQ